MTNESEDMPEYIPESVRYSISHKVKTKSGWGIGGTIDLLTVTSITRKRVKGWVRTKTRYYANFSVGDSQSSVLIDPSDNYKVESHYGKVAINDE